MRLLTEAEKARLLDCLAELFGLSVEEAIERIKKMKAQENDKLG